MLDRQDIDALLVSALYGELTPADEARLTAHLESHPVDRAALDSLTHVRTQVRESRLLAIQLDPPQAISALLLQEAARRAPARVSASEPRESWFYRFVRSFMSQPAMAAACMLVLVVGMAGVLEMKNRGDFDGKTEVAMPTASSAATQTNASAPPESTTASDKFGSGSAAFATPTAVNPAPIVGGVPNDQLALAQEQKPSRREAAGSGYVVGLADTTTAPGKGEAAVTVAPPAKAVMRDRGLAVRTQTLDVKEPRDEDGEGAVGVASNGGGGAPGGAGGGVANGIIATTPAPAHAAAPKPSSASAPAAGDDYKQSPAKPTVSVAKAMPQAPPPPPMTAPAASRAAGGKDASKDKSDKPEDADPNATWAKSEHDRAKRLVASGQCDDAATIAIAIASRAPAYYAANVSTDRDLKPCMAYVARAKRAAAAQAEKAAPPAAANQTVK